MEEVLNWIVQYSPPVAIALIIGASALFVLKTVVEKAVASSYERESKRLELQLSRRTSFEGEILKDRFRRITDLSRRLEQIATNFNRLRAGQPVPEQFMTEQDIPPLTEVYEDLEIHRLVLTEPLYSALRAKADQGQQLARAIRDGVSPEEWNALVKKWRQLDEELRSRVEEQFSISGIVWDPS